MQSIRRRVPAALVGIVVIMVTSVAWGQQKPPIEWVNAGHAATIGGLAFSPDEQMIFSGSGDTTLKMWWVGDGSLYQTLRGHAVSVTGIAFSPDGRHFATSGRDGAARVRLLSRCDPVLILPVFSWVFDLAYSPDGSRLVTVAKGGDVSVWNMTDGSLRWSRTQDRMGFNQWAMSVAYSPDGTTIISGGQFPRIDVWNSETGAQLQSLQGHASAILSVAFSPDGQLFASGSGDKTIKLWKQDEQGNWAVSTTLNGHTDAVNKVLFMPDGQTLLSCSADKTIKLWNLLTGTVIRTWTGHETGVSAIALTLDGQTLASGDNDGKIKLWNVADGSLIRDINKISSFLSSIAYAPDGQHIASTEGFPDSTIQMWDATSGALTWNRAVPGQSYSLAFSPNSAMLAVGSLNHTIRLHQASDGTLVRTLTGHTGNVLSVAWPSDQTLASSAGHPDDTIKLWNVADGTVIRTLMGHTADVFSVAASPDGQWLASGGMDRAVKLWRVSDGALLWSTPMMGPIGHTFWVFSVAFSPDGQVVASGGGDGAVKLWDVADGHLLRTLTGFTGGQIAVSYSPDGQWLSVSNGFKIFLYRVSDWSLLFTYDQETGSEVKSVNFSPDSAYFAYGRLDATVVLARTPAPNRIVGDVNADGCVDETDIALVMAALGLEGCALLEDVNHDGIVDEADLAIVRAHLGEGC